MPDPNCAIRGCIHMPGYVIECGYDETLALASVGAGWADLVREGLAVVAGRGRLVQVKEKFGTLRLYARFDSLDRAPFDALQAIEARSAATCATCGKPGTLTGTSWYRTACAEHVKSGKG